VTKKDFLWKLAYLAIAGGVFMIDQTTKAWATRVLRFEGDRSIISGFLNFAYAKNPGVAFSMLDDNGDAGRWGLSVVALVAATLVLYFFWRTPRTDDRILGSLALLLAGIAGNVTDRMRLGFVVDFVDVQFGSWHYPTFNVADAAICIGAGLLVLDLFFSKRRQHAETNLKSEIQNPQLKDVS
jgi:signal peptidase II